MIDVDLQGVLISPGAFLSAFILALPEPDLHGCQALRLTPLELLQRLARLVPPPEDQLFASVPATDTATKARWLPMPA